MVNEPPIEPLFDSPEERAEAWVRALHWGTPEQLAARGIVPSRPTTASAATSSSSRMSTTTKRFG
jgi:hypothetical protein